MFTRIAYYSGLNTAKRMFANFATTNFPFARCIAQICRKGFQFGNCLKAVYLFKKNVFLIFQILRRFPHICSVYAIDAHLRAGCFLLAWIGPFDGRSNSPFGVLRTHLFIPFVSNPPTFYNRTYSNGYCARIFSCDNISLHFYFIGLASRANYGLLTYLFYCKRHFST